MIAMFSTFLLLIQATLILTASSLSARYSYQELVELKFVRCLRDKSWLSYLELYQQVVRQALKDADVYLKHIVPPVQKCALKDSDCLKKSAQNILSTFAVGIPEAGTETLEPAHIELIEIDLAGLQLTLRNSDIIGLGKSVIDDINFDSSKKVLQLRFHVAPVALKGKYKAGGQLLILPISGDGDVTIKIKNLGVTMDMPYDIKKNENGKDFIDLKSFTFTFENKVNTHFKLTNLFDGNKTLSDTMLKFMNENWSLLSDQFGKPILDAALQKVFTAIKTYLRSQSLDDMAV